MLALQALFPTQARVTYLVGDVNQPETYARALKGVEVLIHTAAVRGIEFCAHHPDEAQMVNVEGTRKLLEVAVAYGVPRFLYCSTQSVYGSSNPYPFREECTPCPETIYGLTKYTGELLVRKVGAGGLRFLIFRFSRLYGLGSFMREAELPHRFARYAVLDRSLPVYHEGKDVVDLLHVRDAVLAVRFFLHLGDSFWDDTYNVGGGETVRICELAELYRETCGKLGLMIPEIQVFPSSPERQPKILGLDTTKIQKAGWRPLHSLEEGVAELLLAYERRTKSPEI